MQKIVVILLAYLGQLEALLLTYVVALCKRRLLKGERCKMLKGIQRNERLGKDNEEK